jgi:hemerythrin-like domain-containing protein
MTATKQLRDEHEGILRMLEIIDRMVEQPQLAVERFEQALEFLKVFADRCHHGKEEDLLFPLLETKGIPRDNGPIGVMLSEHQAGRGFIKGMSDGLEQYKVGNSDVLSVIRENAHGYTNLLRNHIVKENDILFMMAERVLSEQEQQELATKFDGIETERIGIGRHEKFHQLLDEMETIYL